MHTVELTECDVDVEDKFDFCVVFNSELTDDSLSYEEEQAMDKILHAVGRSYYYTFKSSSERFVLIRYKSLMFCAHKRYK